MGGLEENHPNPHILVWKRYVDEILCDRDGPDDSLQQLLTLLNSFHPSLQFTREVGESAINFVDLIVSPQPHGTTHLTPSFRIFRKPSGIMINGSYLQPPPTQTYGLPLGPQTRFYSSLPCSVSESGQHYHRYRL